MAVPDLIQFVNATAADADEVNQNFALVSDFIDSDCMTLDGSKTFTGEVDLGGNKLLRVATPTADTDGANKLYADTVLPVGSVTMFVGLDSDIPAKWVKCDGQELNRTTYSELWNLINDAGTGRYGNGNGVDTFNVPDMASVFPYGAAPAAEGGSADAPIVNHVHPGTTDTDGAHTHDATQGNHSHPEGGRTSDSQAANRYLQRQGAGDQWDFQPSPSTAGYDSVQNPATTSASAGAISVKTTNSGHNHDFTTDDPTDGQAVTGLNLPPFLGFTFIIRTGV